VPFVNRKEGILKMSAPVDKKPDIEAKCKQGCLKYVKDYEACAERVKSGQVHEEGANCSGQYFELYHCIDKCAASKIFGTIKD
jgi:ubiquinol-cytochrome c reductase subunit 6